MRIKKKIKQLSAHMSFCFALSAKNLISFFKNFILFLFFRRVSAHQENSDHDSGKISHR